MAGLGKAIGAILFALLLLGLGGYFVVSTVFKNYVELPRQIQDLQTRIVELEKLNAQQHQNLLSEIELIKNKK